MKDRFWRLLGACEVLTRCETAALARRDFSALGATQQTKSGVLADLATEAALVHASCDSRARARLERLLACNRENVRLLARAKEEAARELRKSRIAAGHLQIFRTAYAAQPSGNSPLEQALFTHV
jgi:hypothetical protein